MNGDGGFSATVFTAENAAKCRDSAAAMRNRAMTAKDAGTRNALTQIADEWDRLAGEIEAALTGSEETHLR